MESICIVLAAFALDWHGRHPSTICCLLGCSLHNNISSAIQLTLSCLRKAVIGAVSFMCVLDVLCIQTFFPHHKQNMCLHLCVLVCNGSTMRPLDDGICVLHFIMMRYTICMSCAICLHN